MICDLLFKTAGTFGVIQRYMPKLERLARESGPALSPRLQKFQNLVEYKVQRATRKSMAFAEAERRRLGTAGSVVPQTGSMRPDMTQIPQVAKPITEPIQPFAPEQRQLTSGPETAKNLGRRKGDILKQSSHVMQAILARAKGKK